MALPTVVSAADVAITPPEMERIHQRYPHPFRHAYLSLTRHDGRQFTAGRYGIEITSAGGTLTAAQTVDLDPASNLPSAPAPADTIGSTGQPVTIEPAPLPTANGLGAQP